MSTIINCSGSSFDEKVNEIKKVNSEIIQDYVDLYLHCKVVSARLEKFKEKIKTTFLAQHITSSAPSDSPYVLEITFANTTSKNKDGIINDLAYRLFGANYENNKAYKNIVRSNTEHGTQTKLLEPKPNPNYKG